jgi:uncharacterized protein (TIGR01777 family)
MSLKIGVTGASGMVGSAASELLRSVGHDVRPLIRTSSGDGIRWNPFTGQIDLDALAELDGVIHLAGENIGVGRWNAQKKKRIVDSRVLGTKLIAESLAKLTRRPSFLVSASAIGYYGDRQDTPLDESAAAGEGFLPGVCEAWERETDVARDAGVRVVNARIGVVLSKKGGALKQMLFPFKMGVGGRIGHGRQYWSWITLTDLLEVLRLAVENDSISGPVNAVSPQPVTNAEFTRELGRAMKRPTFFPLPAFVARIVLGEMVDPLLMASANVVPDVLTKQGFVFKHPSLAEALNAALNAALNE